MTLIELVQQHFDQMKDWPAARVTRVAVSFEDGVSITVDVLADMTLVSGPLPLGAGDVPRKTSPKS